MLKGPNKIMQNINKMSVFSFILHHPYKSKKIGFNKKKIQYFKNKKTIKNMYDLYIPDSKTTTSFKYKIKISLFIKT